MNSQETTVCVVGGGPAGLMLGLLLARQGVDVTVLEKHADFLRDFRGDTVHPSTLDLLDQLGMHDSFAKLPVQDTERLFAVFDDGQYPIADFRRLPGRNKRLAFVPQWDLLELLAETAEQCPSFRLLRTTEATGVVTNDAGRVEGVRAGDLEIRARLTVACDGRTSTIRDQLGMVPQEHAAPMDVLWFRVAKTGDPQADGMAIRFGAGGMLVLIDRGDYLQCACVVPKGTDAKLRADGLDAFRKHVADLAPALAPVLDDIQTLDDVKLLTVKLNRLKRWHAPGVLLIGDAAHAMSPVGGVGINLAVQDAVATARILGPKLAGNTFTDDDLPAVARRRQYPTVVTQALQGVVQNRLIDPTLASGTPRRAPRALTLLKRHPRLQAVPAYVIGRGVLPERI